jgi:hypothetical protein
VSNLFDRFLDDKERALDQVVVAGNRGLQQVSLGLHRAAKNLLDKAFVALDAGEDERAHRFIHRAAALDWDEHEEQYPGPETAHQILYEAVTDACEECAADESDWLDAALEVLPTFDPTAHEHLATTLYSLVLQTDFYDVKPAEAKRIRAATGIRPLDLDPLPEGTSLEERERVVRDLVDATRAFEAAYERQLRQG